MDRLGPGAAAVDLDQRDHGQQPEDPELDRDQRLLHSRTELDPSVGDPGHQRDERDRGKHQGKRRARGAVPSEQQEQVLAGDLRQRRHHDHVGNEDREPGHPAEPRTERPGDPGKARAAVRVGAVQRPIGQRDAEHRHERDEQHRRRVGADAGDRDQQAQRGRHRVGGRSRRDADHDVGQESDRTRLQAGRLRDRGNRPVAHSIRRYSRAHPFLSTTSVVVETNIVA